MYRKIFHCPDPKLSVVDILNRQMLLLSSFVAYIHALNSLIFTKANWTPVIWEDFEAFFSFKPQIRQNGLIQWLFRVFFLKIPIWGPP
jgi:hypothetical protein